MQFKVASYWMIAGISIILILTVIIVGIKWNSPHENISAPKTISDASCKLDSPILTAQTQSWKRYIDGKLCFSFLYPTNATFDKANADTPYEFIRVYDTGFDFQIEYPTSASKSVIVSSPIDVLHQLPDALAQEFSGYKNIAGIQWVELTEHAKIADLKRYYTAKNNYMYTITTGDYDSMLVPDMILQIFQFAADGQSGSNGSQ